MRVYENNKVVVNACNIYGQERASSPVVLTKQAHQWKVGCEILEALPVSSASNYITACVPFAICI